MFRGTGRTGREDLLHAARVLLWVRWLGLIAALVEIHYRVDYGSLSHILNIFCCLGFLAANGYVQWLIHRRGTVKPAWLLGLSALDLAVISFSTASSGGFNSPYFVVYYFAVAVFAYVFTSPRFVLPWTTLVAVIYTVLSFTVEPALDLVSWIIETRSPQRTAKAPVYKPSDKFPPRITRSWPCHWPQRHDSCSFLRLQNGIFSLNVHRL